MLSLAPGGTGIARKQENDVLASVDGKRAMLILAGNRGQSSLNRPAFTKTAPPQPAESSRD